MRHLPSLLALLIAAPALAEAERVPLPDVPRLEVVGQASERRVPDRARVRVVIGAAGATSEGVSREVATTATRVAEVVRAAGIEDADTATIGPRIEPRYEPVQSGQGRDAPRQNGYQGRVDFSFETVALDVLPALVPRIGAAGGLVEGIAFSVSDLTARERELEARAVADAVERAGQLIRAAGAQPGRVLSIAVGELGDNGADLPRRKAPAPVASAVTIPVRPGRETVSRRVTVSVEILPR